MISLDQFYRAYQTFRYRPDEDQKEAIEQGPKKGVFIVAGPGTGKTTCLSLRILKLIFVDGIPPRSILATTFTKKAAAELRSRILGWGYQLIEALEKQRLPKETREKIDNVDINQVITGTIDSICEQLLRDFRDPGVLPPILVDDFVSKTLLLREGLLAEGRYQNADLDAFLLGVNGGGKFGFNVGRKTTLLQNIWDRRFHDQMEWEEFLRRGPKAERDGRRVLGDALGAYEQYLIDNTMVDFALLEQEVLNRLYREELSEFLKQIKVVLVDEYQDTNLMQEAIYFELAKSCSGALNIVGDDDQSLYRFRGATVELFSEFAERYRADFGKNPQTVFLRTNYRSTRRIVDLFNGFAGLDPDYQDVRVQRKPALEYGPVAEEGVPILGMFRENVEMLAEDLADFVYKVFRGRGYVLNDEQRIQRDPQQGNIGDCALLCSSPSEYTSSGKPRLPLLLREELRNKSKPIELFNPRGQDLSGIGIVEIFGGLLLECLDPGAEVQGDTSGLSQDMINTFDIWRQTAIDFVDVGAPKGLEEYAVGWVERDPGRRGWGWPESVPVLQLVYDLVHFFPELHDDPEGQIYLEVFTRQMSACEQVGKFSGRVVTNPDKQSLADASIKELLRNFLGPIAGGSIKVNEELMEDFPRDRLSVLSIHQAKGLEFPLIIVDMGSDFKGNHWTHAFKRYPQDGGVPHRLEDMLRPYTDLGDPDRSMQDRSFDDLYRQFFVAYSRPQDVLLMVGLDKSRPGGAVKNVASGWTRTDYCAWSDDIPFEEI